MQLRLLRHERLRCARRTTTYCLMGRGDPSAWQSVSDTAHDSGHQVTTLTPAHRVESPALFVAPANVGDHFGIYVHVPFCAHICPYCDFNTYAGQDFRIPAYVEALRQEISVWAPRFQGRTAGYIFIGGGTPSLLSPEQVSEFVAPAGTVSTSVRTWRSRSKRIRMMWTNASALGCSTRE